MSGAGEDRRGHARSQVELPARVLVDDQVVDAPTVNLSESGVLLAGGDFPESTVVQVEIDLAELGWQALRAEVVRVQAGPTDPPRLAARFAESATTGGRTAIRRFLDDHFPDREPLASG
jgi:hypothetical protein